MKNIGPVSMRWLKAAGIRTRRDLEALGAVNAYRRVRARGFKPSMNLLYALAGAIADVPWNKLPRAERRRLVLELDAADDAARRAAGL